MNPYKKIVKQKINKNKRGNLAYFCFAVKIYFVNFTKSHIVLCLITCTYLKNEY